MSLIKTDEVFIFIIEVVVLMFSNSDYFIIDGFNILSRYKTPYPLIFVNTEFKRNKLELLNYKG